MKRRYAALLMAALFAAGTGLSGCGQNRASVCCGRCRSVRDPRIEP